jgi:hypothetical protein
MLIKEKVKFENQTYIVDELNVQGQFARNHAGKVYKTMRDPNLMSSIHSIHFKHIIVTCVSRCVLEHASFYKITFLNQFWSMHSITKVHK